MKTKLLATAVSVMVFLSLFIYGCSKETDPLTPDVSSSGLNQINTLQKAGGEAGTTLSGAITATGFWKEVHSYDWTISKNSEKQNLTIIAGNSETVNYTLTSTRNETVTNEYGISGSVTVTNGGDIPTENLKIDIVIQSKSGPGQFQDYYTHTLDLSSKPVLASKETNVYTYEVKFTPVAGALYKAVAKIIITNHSGSLGIPKGPAPKTDFMLPTRPILVYIDKEANLSDLLNVPNGFSAVETQIPTVLTQPGTLNYSVNITNKSVSRGTTVILTNNVTLTEGTTGVQRNASASVSIFTGEIIVTNNEGCSLSQGYWFSKPNLVWGRTVKVAGYTYTQEEGKAIWLTDNAGGIKDSKAGFLQVAAIKLSGSSVSPTASVWNDVQIVEIYLSGLGKLSPTNLPTGNQAVKDAAGRIGNWINIYHCTE